MQALIAGQFLQQFGLALGIDDRLDRHTSHLAIHHFQLVGEHIVDTQARLHLAGKVGKPTGQDGSLVTQALELGEQVFRAFGQAQRGADLVQHAHIQALEQRHALLETGAEVQLATHGAFGDRRHLLTYASRLGQLVDDFGLDQRRIHVEYRQAAVAAEQVIFLEGNVDAQRLRQGEEIGTQGLGIARHPTHGYLDRRLALVGVGVQRHPGRQPLDAFDRQAVLADHRTDPLQLLGGDLAAEQGHHMARLTMAVGPVLVVRLGNRRITGLQVQLVGLGLHTLQQGSCHFVVRDIDQDAERQGAVHDRQADVEDTHTALQQDAGDCRSETGTVLTGDVDQDDFAHNLAPTSMKNAHSTDFP